MTSQTIIIKVSDKQKKQIVAAAEKTMRTIASIARQGIMNQVEEILENE
jgi:predicted transcriptional regulator